MPIDIQWHKQQPRLMELTFKGQWDNEAFVDALTTSTQAILETPHTVHMIYNFSESSTPPRDMLAGLHFANRVLPPNQGVVVYLNANSVIKAFVLMAKRFDLAVTRYLYHADSHQEAFKLIKTKAERTQMGR
ncbi:MAG: hypothetical protein AAFN11_13170 [Chloroflexota bacterium]